MSPLASDLYYKIIIYTKYGIVNKRKPLERIPEAYRMRHNTMEPYNLKYFIPQSV